MEAQMLDMFNALKLMEHIMSHWMVTDKDGKKQMTDDPVTLWEAAARDISYTKKDHDCLGRIQLRVWKHALPYVQSLSTALEAWDMLQEIYKPKSSFTFVQLSM